MCSQQQVLQKKKLGKIPSFFHLEVTPGFEPGNEGFAANFVKNRALLPTSCKMWC